ncbi:MAG: hypothetical protein WBG90_01675 [Saonia sp.]
MKNISFTILIVLGIFATGLAQESKISKAELKSVFEPYNANVESLYNKLLCKRWEFKYVFIDQAKLPKLPENKYFDILFKSNGTYELIEKNGSAEKGNWNYDQDKKSIYLTSKNDFNARVKFIEENELIITMLSNDNNPMRPNGQIHFRPFTY